MTPMAAHMYTSVLDKCNNYDLCVVQYFARFSQQTNFSEILSTQAQKSTNFSNIFCARAQNPTHLGHSQHRMTPLFPQHFYTEKLLVSYSRRRRSVTFIFECPPPPEALPVFLERVPHTLNCNCIIL